MHYPQLTTYPIDLLANRVVLITGAYGGLGHHLTRACASLGATVVLLGRSMSRLEKLYDELEQSGAAQPGIIPLDLESATAKDYADIAITLENEFSQLNALVHCAAILGSLSPIQGYSLSDWNRVMATNLNGPVLLTQACLPLMNESNNASITFTLDKKDSAYWGAYGVSKAALMSFAKILADETEGKKDNNGFSQLAVNCIDPGPMRTRLRRKAFPGELPEESPEVHEKIASFINLIARTDPALTGTTLSLISTHHQGTKSSKKT